MTRWMRIALALPGSALVLVTAVALAGALLGRHPLWPDDRLNLAEAAGMRDVAEVIRLTGLGEDPNLPRDIREGLVADEMVRLTPLEAAVAVDDGSVVSALLTHGAAPDAGLWNRVICLARSDEMKSILEEHRGPGGEPACAGIEWPW